jgi:hypothetical protein
MKGPPPQFCTIPDEDLDKIGPDDVQHNRVRVAITREYTENEKRETAARIMGFGARSCTFMDNIKERTVVVSEGTESQPEDTFESWLVADKDGVKGLQPALLRRLNADVVREGDEVYLASLEDDQ